MTPETLFRGAGSRSLAGPYLSQFLCRDLFLPPMWVKQQVRTAAAGYDYLTARDTWLACQNGALTGVNRFDERPRHIRNGRDLGEWVHRDFTYQAALDACLVLLKLGVPASGANPYMHSRTQTGFATFGAPYLFYLLAVVTQVALTATWFQKWCVHRRLRPEEFAGRVEIHRTGRARYPLPPAVLASAAADELTRRHGGESPGPSGTWAPRATRQAQRSRTTAQSYTFCTTRRFSVTCGDPRTRVKYWCLGSYLVGTPGFEPGTP